MDIPQYKVQGPPPAPTTPPLLPPMANLGVPKPIFSSDSSLEGPAESAESCYSMAYYSIIGIGIKISHGERHLGIV